MARSSSFASKSKMDNFPDIPEDAFLEKGIFFNYADLPERNIDQEAIKAWLYTIAKSRQKEISSLSYIFSSDDYLHDINVEFLNHDTLTDIITFPLESEEGISGEIYISLDRVEDNAKDFKTDFFNELRRVIAHGLLHLCGINDKTEQEAAEMRRAEEDALALWDRN